jgi:hypothetical protein
MVLDNMDAEMEGDSPDGRGTKRKASEAELTAQGTRRIKVRNISFAYIQQDIL